MAGHTPGPWFVSGARFRMNHGEWHSVNRYDEAKKHDDNIACVGFDPRTGDGLADAHLIAAAPELLQLVEAFVQQEVEYMTVNNLGDPEKQHNVRWARAVIAKIKGCSPVPNDGKSDG